MSKKLGADNLNEPILDHVRFEYVTLLDTQTVGDALATLRSQTLAEQIIYFYVVNADGALMGVVPTRRLLMSPLESKIADIMVGKLVTVPYSASVLDVCELFIQHRFLSLPVVDDERRLMGVADVSLFTDVFDVAERQRGEDVYQLIGIHLSSHRSLNPLQSFGERFPWLMCNIAGGVLCAILSSFYESYLVDVVVLALFIPVVLALSESVSIQAMTIALEALHGDRLDIRFVMKALAREFAAAFLLGVACGGTVGTIAWLWKGQPWVATAIGGSIAMAMITACLLGVALPALVRSFRIDPRIAAGPIVLATADVATLLFYFNLAGWLLGL